MLGRILGYTPHREASPGFLPLDVPSRGLSPNALPEAYNANPLAAAGFTGKGETIVFFEFGGYDQKHLDAFASSSGLPRFMPVLVGGQPTPSGAETVMDLEVAHAIAPDSQTAYGVGGGCSGHGRGGCHCFRTGHTCCSGLCVPTRLREAADRQACRYAEDLIGEHYPDATTDYEIPKRHGGIPAGTTDSAPTSAADTRLGSTCNWHWTWANT